MSLTTDIYTDIVFIFQLYELLFENMRLPAAYTCHNATLASFCAARPSSLVVDLGADEIRIVPIVDGFSLNRSIVRTTRGGNAMDRYVENCIISRLSRKREHGQEGGRIKPWFQCNGASCPADITESFYRAHVGDVIRDVKHWMCFIPSTTQTTAGPKDSTNSTTDSVEDIIKRMPHYELPDGTCIVADEDICLSIEKQLFPCPQQSSSRNSKGRRSRGSGGDPSSAPDINDDDPLHRLIYNAVDKCDVDVRKELLANIVLVGGGALLEGLSQRLSQEIPKMVPANVKVCVYTYCESLTSIQCGMNYIYLYIIYNA